MGWTKPATVEGENVWILVKTLNLASQHGFLMDCVWDMRVFRVCDLNNLNSAAVMSQGAQYENYLPHSLSGAWQKWHSLMLLSFLRVSLATLILHTASQ